MAHGPCLNLADDRSGTLVAQLPPERQDLSSRVVIKRLWWYSRFFDTVEVSSTFYVLLSPDTTALWGKRNEPGFLFNVKAYGLLTGRHLDAARLPDALRTVLPGSARTKDRGVITNSTFGA